MVLKRLNDSIYFGNAVYSVKNSVFMTISLQLPAFIMIEKYKI